MITRRRFELLYAAAFSGLFVAFLPFLSVLLPLKVGQVDAVGRVELLGRLALAGAAIASVANIACGAASDRTYRRRGTRRPWIALGLVLIVVGFAAIDLARTPAALLAAILFWQVALNMMFAPLTAVMADEVPDERKGWVAGLIGIAHPLAMLAGVVVTLPVLTDEHERYAANVALFVVLIVPFLLFARERGDGDATLAAVPTTIRPSPADLARTWAARLAMQVAGNGMTLYAFFHFQNVLAADAPGQAPEAVAARIAQAMALVTLVAVAATIGCGRASDRSGRRRPYLAGGAVAVVAGLATMAGAQAWATAVLGYGLAVCGLSVFLALNSALAMQLLPSPRHRGRDLGVLNLANTLPAMVPPLLAMLLSATGGSLAPVFLTLAAVGALAGMLAVAIRTER